MNIIDILIQKLNERPREESFELNKITISANPDNGDIKRISYQDIFDKFLGELGLLEVGFAGTADPATDPGDPSTPVFYITTESGTYANFLDDAGNPITVDSGEFTILGYNGNFWTKQVVSMDLNGYVTISGMEDGLDEISKQTLGKNLIDKTKIVAGEYYSVANNRIQNNTNYRRTDYIPVEAGETYTYSGYAPGNNIGGYFAEYGDVNAISGISFQVGKFTVPEGQGINYVILNITSLGRDDTTYDNTVQLEKGDTATSYEPYSFVRKVTDSDLQEEYAKSNELIPIQEDVQFLTETSVSKDLLFDTVSKNLIDPSKADLGRRYSTTLKRITTSSTTICMSGYIEVEEGELYTVSGNGIYNIAAPQGGYFAEENDINAIDNITFFNPVAGEGKVFQVPIGSGIKYVVISLNTNDDHDELVGESQMEHGEMATPYEPYNPVPKIKKELLPDNGGGSGSSEFDDRAWLEYTEGEMRQDMSKFMPEFRKHWLLKDKDLMVINTGTSLTARSSEHCTTRQDATSRPPLLHANNLASLILDKIMWDNQFYRRYDYPGFFTETGTFNKSFNEPEWDDGAYRNGLTRFSDSNGAKVQFQIPENAWQFNLIYRTDSQGSSSISVSISEGNGQVEVYDGANWIEANGYSFSMNEPTPVTRTVSIPNPANQSFSNYTISTRANTTYQKRLKMRCKSGSINSLSSVKNVTIENQTSGRLLYWGVEWSLREHMITFVNAARGSHATNAAKTAGLPRFADNEIWEFKPDLIFSELGIHNDGAGSDSALGLTFFQNCTYNYVFNTDYELSMLKRCQDLNGYTPEIIMFNATITWNFNGINEDGTLKLMDDGGGNMVTCLDKFNAAAEWWWENEEDYGFINSTRRYVEACFKIFGDMKTATSGSGKDGNTFTNEGSHPNDTGSKVWAKTLLGCFDFI